MPEFCSSLPSSKAGAKLTKSELIRAIRFMIAAEYEAVGLYTQLVDSIDCEKAKAVPRFAGAHGAGRAWAGDDSPGHRIHCIDYYDVYAAGF